MIHDDNIILYVFTFHQERDDIKSNWGRKGSTLILVSILTTLQHEWDENSRHLVIFFPLDCDSDYRIPELRNSDYSVN